MCPSPYPASGAWGDKECRTKRRWRKPSWKCCITSWNSKTGLLLARSEILSITKISNHKNQGVQTLGFETNSGKGCASSYAAHKDEQTQCMAKIAGQSEYIHGNPQALCLYQEHDWPRNLCHIVCNEGFLFGRACCVGVYIWRQMDKGLCRWEVTATRAHGIWVAENRSVII